MPKIIQLSPQIANLIAAGEVVERPASVVKELLENAVDAGASQITVELRDGGMTFLRVTDNGCGMTPEDARTAFLRHATSKLRQAEDLAAITTMGFRGEALAAIASVSRVDLLTKTAGSLAGVSLHLEAGTVTEESEAGCPEGTTILIRDLFFNTPARMKFMKSDTVEGSRCAAAVQLQALAHPSVAFRFLKDGKEVLSTPGTGNLMDAAYSVYGKSWASMVPVESRWEGYSLSGFVCKPSDARPSRNQQTFFVNDRPVKDRLLTTALEEAYRNQLMVGKFPTCLLHRRLPPGVVDVNVHPAKTEVKFLNEKAVFDCVQYGVLGALNKAPDRPQVQFSAQHAQKTQPVQQEPRKDFFKTVTPAEFRAFSQTLRAAPAPDPASAAATASKLPLRQQTAIPKPENPGPQRHILGAASAPAADPKPDPQTVPQPVPEPEQTALPMPEEAPWRLVGELYRTYLIVEQGENAYLIDKHAAHERILFDRLRANQEPIASQALLTPISCRLSPGEAGELLENRALLAELGFEIDEFGENTVLLRQIPMDLSEADGEEALQALAADLLNGRRAKAENVRDELLHTVACKAAIKAGWQTDERELLALAEQVMAREDLKHCPHGRPICVTLSKKQLEKQFKRT